MAEAEKLRDLIGLAEVQLAGQLETLHHTEAKALALVGLDAALVGLDAALVAAVVTGGQTIWGRRWWAALIGLGISAFALWQVAADEQFQDGPKADGIYASYSGLDDVDFGRQLLADLESHIGRNQLGTNEKVQQLGSAFGLLTITVIYSACLFAWAR